MKVVLLGLDGASLNILERVMNFKRLPNFEEILRKGASGELQSVYPYTTAPAWASLLSGRNPAKHGVFEMFQVKNRQLVPFNILSFGVPYVWDYLSWAGKKVLSIGVPFVFPSPKINGVFINGRFAPLSTYPKELATTLTEWRYQLGSPFPETKDAFSDFLKRGKGVIVQEILGSFEKRLALSFCLFDQRAWDMALIVENLPDEILHICFDDKEILSETFSMLDEMVGEFLSRLKNPDLLLIVSDHGFASVEKCFLLNQWLMNLGVLSLKCSKSAKLKRFIGSSKLAVDVYRSLIRVFPFLASRIGQNFSEDLIFSPSKIALNSEAVAYNINEPVAWIKILAKTQSERERMSETIRKELLNPNLSQVIKRVIKPEKIYSGPYMNHATGDLIVEAKQGFTLDTFRITNRKVFLPPLAWKRGVHQIDGILLAYGSYVKHSHVKASIYDISPTVLHYLGLPISGDMDGAVIEQIFVEGSEPALRKPQKLMLPTKTDQETKIYSEEEKAKVLKRLKVLGYLG